MELVILTSLIYSDLLSVNKHLIRLLLVFYK